MLAGAAATVLDPKQRFRRHSLKNLRINEYQLEGGSWPVVADVILRRMPQREGSDKWAIFDRGACLDKDGDWVFQPLPSSRDDEFMRSCRFDSAEEALAFWKEGDFASRFARYDAVSAKTEPNPSCGHPLGSIVSSDEGTSYCGECEREAR